MGSTKTTTVLVVDDNPMDRRVAGACVEECGMSAAYAADGDEALRALDTADIVLTDLDMPGMDGLELVRRVRTLSPAIPVILMTAKGSEETAAEALKAGAASYVPKSKLRTKLEETLKIVRHAAMARELRQDAYGYVVSHQTQFVIENDDQAVSSLVSHLQDALIQMSLCSEGELLAIGTALLEAFQHAVDRGNLELDPDLRSQQEGADYAAVRLRRLSQPPYCHRKVFVTACLTPEQAEIIIRDQGPGFDLSTIPDPDFADNLVSDRDRGLLLIQMFMDEVRFNASGNEITLLLYANGEDLGDSSTVTDWGRAST